MNIPDSEVNDAERQLADHFNEIRIQAMNEFNGVEIVEWNTLDFSEPYKDWEPSAVEDTYAEWTPKLDSKQPPESLELKMSQMLTVGHRGAGCSWGRPYID